MGGGDGMEARRDDLGDLCSDLCQSLQIGTRKMFVGIRRRLERVQKYLGG